MARKPKEYDGGDHGGRQRDNHVQHMFCVVFFPLKWGRRNDELFHFMTIFLSGRGEI